jgi:hypothetical protein
VNLFTFDWGFTAPFGQSKPEDGGHPAWSGIFRGDGGFSVGSGEREFVLFFGQVVAAANGCDHVGHDVWAPAVPVSRFERPELRGERAVAEHLLNPAGEIASPKVPIK